MFDFFKKRAVAKNTKPNPQKELVEKTKEIIKITNPRSDKQAEIARAASLVGQEQAALAFILQSNCADARLQAAAHIHSQEGLAQVAQAMRNVDRRVCKQVQDKLTKLQKQQKMDEAIKTCLVQGKQLLATLPLMVNDVAAWDKQRLALGEAGSVLLPTKAELEQRLQVQLDLQRQALNVIEKLRNITANQLSLEHAQTELVQCQLEWQDIQSSDFVVSLPKNQLAQCEEELVKALSIIEQLSSVDVSPPVVEQEVRPAVESKDAFEQMPKQPSPINVKAKLKELEQALQDGALQVALDIDKTLRKVELSTSDVLAQRYTSLRTELHRLLDWAKWSGDISREELINIAANLVKNNLSPPEVAKQLGGLRSRWKELDRTNGGAVQALWERFNEACDKAHNIVDAYFKEQVAVRSANFDVAQTQLAALDDAIGAIQNGISDWKAHQSYINKAKLDWRNIGPIDRKLSSQCEETFQKKMATLLQPLNQAREGSINTRRHMIEEMRAIVHNGQANQRSTVEQVQKIQQRWQQEALHIPLKPREENKLWHEFRAACDAVFVERQAKAQEQHQRRNQLTLNKQNYCEKLENALDKSHADIVDLLRKAKHQWRDLTGEKHKPDELDQRFHAAIKQLEKRDLELINENKKAALENLRAKIKLCRQRETGADNNDVEWSSLDSKLLSAELNKLLAQRFHRAQAKSGTDAIPAAEELLLRIELLRGIPSPPELAQQRLQLQVSELKSAMKHGDAHSNYLKHFYALCAMPVSLSEQQEQRFQTILDNFLTK